MKNEDFIQEVARWMIENQATVKQAADYFQKSESTIQKYINKKLVLISADLYHLLKKTQNIVLARARQAGGRAGKRQPAITDFEALEMASYRIDTGATYEELSNIFGYSSSSIYDAISRLQYEDLLPLLENTTQDNLRMRSRGFDNLKDTEVIEEEKIRKR